MFGSHAPHHYGFLERLWSVASRHPRKSEQTICTPAKQPGNLSLHFKKLTERNGQEIWSASVTLIESCINNRNSQLLKRLTRCSLREAWPSITSANLDKYRALAAKLGNDYVWFWIGEHGTYDHIT